MRKNSSYVIVEYRSAINRRLPPILGKLPASNTCRYCICVLPNGACNKLDKAVIESNHVGLDCEQGVRVYRDLDHDPKLVPYTVVGSAK